MAVHLYPLPPLVREALQQHELLHAGFQGAWCWVQLQGQVLLWQQADSVDARVITIRPPVQLTDTLVSVAESDNTSTTVVMASSTGRIYAWPILDMVTDPVEYQVRGLAASAKVTKVATVATVGCLGVTFIACLACSDHSMHLVYGSDRSMSDVALDLGQQNAAGNGSAQPPSLFRKVAGSMLNSVVNVANSAFDPLARFYKTTPSGHAPLAISMRAVDAQQVLLYVLTESTLDCWEVTLSPRIQERFLWSSLVTNAAAAAPSARLQHATNKALAVAGDAVYVLMADQHGNRTSSWLHRMHVRPGVAPINLAFMRLPEKESSEDTPLCNHVQSMSVCDQAVLLLTTHHTAYEFLPPGTPPAHVGSKRPRSPTAAGSTTPARLEEVGGGRKPLAAGSQSGGGSWLLLTRMQGVVQLEVGSAEAKSSTAQRLAQDQQQARELLPEQQNQVKGILDSFLAVPVTDRQSQAGRELQTSLAGFGIWGAGSNAAVLSHYATALIDDLPKNQGMTGASDADTILRQISDSLAAKADKLEALLTALKNEGLLRTLPREVQRDLAAVSEKLGAAQAVLTLYDTMQSSGGNARATDTIREIITLAGGRVAATQTAETLPHAQLFFARPSSSLPAVYQALGTVADSLAQNLTSTSVQYVMDSLEGAIKLLYTVIDGTTLARQRVDRSYSLDSERLGQELRQTSWCDDSAARDALHKMTTTCDSLRSLMDPSGQSPMGDFQLQLTFYWLKCVAALLTAYRTAVAATPVGGGQEELLQKYKACRERWLEALLKESLKGNRNALPAPQAALVQQVELCAAENHCYPVLFEACETIDRRAGSSPGPTMYRRMQEVEAECGAPDTDTFARYVFEYLFDKNRHSDLLQLPTSFYVGLAHFLGQQPGAAHLLWILLVRHERWSDAVRVLELDAQAQQTSYKEQQRLYSLCKVIAYAIKDKQALKAADRKLAQLRVQEELLSLSANLSEEERQQLRLTEAAMELHDLVQSGLGLERFRVQGYGALSAVKALMMFPEPEYQAQRENCHQAWLLVAKGTDWNRLDQEKDSRGAAAAQDTPLYQAVRVCQKTQHGSSMEQTASARLQEGYKWLQDWSRGNSVAEKYVKEAFGK